MARSARRAVFTGIGVLSPLGTGYEAFRTAIAAGKSGIRPISVFDASKLPCPIAGEIPEFDAKKIVAKEARKTLRVMARTVQIGVAAAQLAGEHARWEKGKIDPFRFGVEFGCVMVASDLVDLARGAIKATERNPRAVNLEVWGTSGLGDVPPLWMLKYLPNMPACHVSIAYDAQGPNNTITAGDAAGLLALGEAYRILQRDAADVFLVGGCDSRMNPLSMARHSLFQPLTKRISEPEKASRPYAADRDGIVIGEAGAVYFLEELEAAKARGATIYGELVGFASGCDRDFSSKVYADVLRRALSQAGITPDDVDHVNGSGGGSLPLDAFEARAIAEVFGDRVPVVALRGAIGNCGAASGLVELAAVFSSYTDGLPATLNADPVAGDCPIRIAAPRPVAKPFVVKTSLTDLGQIAVAVIRHPNELQGMDP